MGDTSQRMSSERPLETELAAVDLVAAFHLTDNFPIHHYCAAADQLDNVDPELVSVLREIGDCLNEKDREDEAWSQPLNLSHDLAKTWLAAAQTSNNIQSYFDATQRTPSAADAQSFDSKDGEGVFQYLKLSQSQASQATQASLLMHPPNQQQQRQMLSPERRSSRSPQPRKMPGFVIEIDKGAAAASASIPTKFSNTKTIFVSTDSESDGLTAPARKRPSAQSSSATSKASKGKRAKGKGKRKSKPPRTAASSINDDSDFSSSPPEVDEVSEGGTPAALTAEERKLLKSAKKLSDAADKTLQPSQKRKRFSIIDTSEESGGEQGSSTKQAKPSTSATGTSSSRTYTSAKSVKSRRTSKTLSGQKELLGPGNEDDELEINISAPAYASKEGFTTSEGYKGFHYIKSWSKRSARGNDIKENWMCIEGGNPYTASQGHSSNLKVHKSLCRGPKDASASSKLRQKLEDMGLDSSHVELGKKTAAADGTQKLAPAGGSASSMMRSWLENQQTVNAELTRRLILVTVIRQALPFRWPSSESNQKRLVDKSPSSFPQASSRRSGSWTASQNKILCLNHHVNLAVQAGFKTLGVKLATKTQNKILDIHPQPSIQLTDASGKTVVAHERNGSNELSGLPEDAIRAAESHKKLPWPLMWVQSSCISESRPDISKTSAQTPTSTARSSHQNQIRFLGSRLSSRRRGY
ncbi:hypothetical protein V8E36_006723 [Tilletia maclaganii]